MHDIGKVGVPDTILLKPGKLNDEEFDAIKKHCRVGADILAESDIPVLNMARDIALGHHEKWDGTGYPSALAGKDIPQCARIVAIADVYDALRNHGVYRPAIPEEKAIKIMSEGNGRQFDPDIFECFLDRLEEFHNILGKVRDEEMPKALSIKEELERKNT